MKLFLAFDSRLGGLTLEARNAAFRHWCTAIQEIGIYAQHRGFEVCVICLGPSDYHTFMQLQQKCDPASMHQAIRQMASYIQLEKDHSITATDTSLNLLRKLIDFFRNVKKDRDFYNTKIILISGNFHKWFYQTSPVVEIVQSFMELQIDLQCIHVFDQSNPQFIELITLLQKLSEQLKEFDNFSLTFQPIEDILICKHLRQLLAVDFTVTLERSVAEQRILRCQALPLSLRLSEETANDLQGRNVTFDIRARTKPSAVSQHVICGLPVALYEMDYLKLDWSLTSLASLCKELVSQGDVLIFRSNLDPVSLLISPEKIRHLWIGMPADEMGQGVMCVQGLISQEFFVSIHPGISAVDTISNDNAKSILEDLVELPLYNPLMYKCGLYEHMYNNLLDQAKTDGAATKILLPNCGKRVLTSNPTPSRRGRKIQNARGRGRAALGLALASTQQREALTSLTTYGVDRTAAVRDQLLPNAPRKNEEANTNVNNTCNSRATLCGSMIAAFGSSNETTSD